MGLSCSYFNNAFLMPAFNPEDKKFLRGGGGLCKRKVGYIWPIDMRDRFLSKIRPFLSFIVMNKFSFLVVSF